MNATLLFLFALVAKSMVFAADVCKDDLAVTYLNSLTASSEKDQPDKTSNYAAERALLNTTEAKDAQGVTQMGSWVAEKNDFNQWIQVELKDMAMIRGIVTQGRNGCCKDWVTKYRVMYSEDCQTWHTVEGFNVTDAFFKGNSDQDTPVTNPLRCPVMAKCIRINPLGHNGNIAMRLGIQGCPLTLASTATTAAPTATPTTAAPTAAPTTAAPTTTVPTTAVPITTAAATAAPTTAAPTQAPTTAAPITAAPAVRATTVAPAGGSPNGSGSKPGSGNGVKGCITTCQGKPNGDYPSCAGCTSYATCVWGSMFDARACPHGLAWDDSVKRCDKKSSTCP